MLHSALPPGISIRHSLCGTTDDTPINCKQNSDAIGLSYQWGRKDPFTFATSSENNTFSSGKYPVKIYTIDGVLIYQENEGKDNTDKQPAGGIIVSSTLATSMMETIKKPVTFIGPYEIILTTDNSKSLWDYYWVSHSRGTDGAGINLKRHNNYLDGYLSQRLKSIYDPCPYGFRIPSNGTYNDFSNYGWTKPSYIGGNTWSLKTISSWHTGGSLRNRISGQLVGVGFECDFLMSCSVDIANTYSFVFNSDATIYFNNIFYKSRGMSVRCIDLTMFLLLHTSA